MKKALFLLVVLVQFQTINAQIKLKYGAAIGMNISTAILPELKLNTNINSILRGDNVVQGNPQLADFMTLYKAGIFIKLDGNIGAAKLNLDYTVANIHKDIHEIVFNVNALDINLSYIDINITYNLNLYKGFYLSAGYVPSFLLAHEGNLDIDNFDQRVLVGFGFGFKNGITIDFDTIVGLTEVIEGSYIHNIMIPITLSIPFN